MRLNRLIKFNALFIFLTATNLFAQEEPILLKFNRIDYSSPPSQFFAAESKTFYNYTQITIDLNLETITIETKDADGSNKSTYKIDEISELLSSPSRGQYFRFTCIASNYSEVIIEVDQKSEWVETVVSHNNIKHKYYLVL